MKSPFLLLIGTACFVLSGCSRNEMKGIMDITFQVEAPGLAENATVYITGNHYMIGDWEPGVMPLTRKGDDVWELKLSIPYGERLQYKFTQGDWHTEALDDNGQTPPNHTLAATRSYIVRHKITRWKSDIPSVGNVTGDVRFHRAIGNEQISPRDIIVWLPPNYSESDDTYPVLYAHDGQNLFDPMTSYIGIDWNIDETADRLIREGLMKPVIVVGIYNSPRRMDEYGFGETGAAYRDYVINTVKPLIDATYRTLPDRNNTATMGSSMGGLVSFLLAWNHPEVFRQAACLSPAFFPEVVDMVRVADAAPSGMRVYMDNGTEGMEQRIQFFCDDMMDVLPGKGFTSGDNFEWLLDRGAEHNEQAWAVRVHRPLLFMFGTGASP
ncbi:MAG TPA: alpha/beta hydrolase-fold protein [Kiritimatiellia bacterium]|nr:alpha/beta hydrolase-fold protein [Kiritimatiellia bacterium]